MLSTAAFAGTGSDANGSTTKAAIAATKGSTAKKPKTVPNCALGYVVANNDGWYSIARKSQVTVAALLAINSATVQTPIYVGSTVCLPAGATPTTSAVPTTAPVTTAPVTTAPVTTAPVTTAPVTTVSVPTTTVPAPTTTVTPTVVPISVFPVQGPCGFVDSWGAPRGGGRKHQGVDIIASAGRYLYAVVDGTLTRQAFEHPGSLSGNGWWLTAANGDYFFYAHLSAFAPGLQVGSHVVAGQILGWVGSTGDASGPHLHFEVHPNGGPAINPYPTAKAVDACRTTKPLPQPDGVFPTQPAAGSPTTTVPGATAPATTAPATTTPVPSSSTGGAGAAAASKPGQWWTFMAPKTAYDSAWGTTPLASVTAQKIRVDQLAGVPVGTSSVMVRLVARSAGMPGYLVAYPCGSPVPVATTLSFDAAGTSAGSSVVGVVDGSICVWLSTPAFVKVEVLAAKTVNGVGVVPVNTSRVADTRTTGRLAVGAALTLGADALGVTPGTQALTATITLVNPSANGLLSLGFCGQGGWQVPFSGDPISSFTMTMRASTAGWCITSSVDVDVIVDINGVWASGSGAVSITGVAPTRLFDSRTTGAKVTAVGVTVPMTGIASGAATVMVSVTTVSGTQATSVFVYPCGQPRSAGTVSAQSPYRVTTAVVPVAVGAGGVCVASIQPADVIIDVVGIA